MGYISYQIHILKKNKRNETENNTKDTHTKIFLLPRQELQG